jgi:hypothetical protein
MQGPVGATAPELAAARHSGWRLPVLGNRPPEFTCCRYGLRDDRRRGHVPSRLLGAAGIWYIVREFRTVKWSRPVFRRGARSGETEYAVFVLGDDERPSYKVLALTSANGDLVVHELMADKHSPENMFLKTMEPGYYRRSELVRGAGEPSVVHLKGQGINLGTFESADYLVFWDGHRFKQWWMSD